MDMHTQFTKAIVKSRSNIEEFEEIENWERCVAIKLHKKKHSAKSNGQLGWVDALFKVFLQTATSILHHCSILKYLLVFQHQYSIIARKNSKNAIPTDMPYNTLHRVANMFKFLFLCEISASIQKICNTRSMDKR